jgi:polyphenol oxidase
LAGTRPVETELPVSWTRSTVGRARVLFTDRTGGVSGGCFASANLAEHVGDDPRLVAENRRRAMAALAGASEPECEHVGPGVWIGAAFRHGADVSVVDRATVERHRAGLRPDELPAVDALVTACPDAVLAMLGGDCAPVALVGDHAVAAAHVGWRGLQAGVVEAAVTALRAVSPGPIRALVGPTVGPCCYEFGSHDLDAVTERIGSHVRSSTRAGAPALDLPAGLRSELARTGVDPVDVMGVCTACSDRHFSYRRDGTTGRQAVLVRWAPAMAVSGEARATGSSSVGRGHGRRPGGEP